MHGDRKGSDVPDRWLRVFCAAAEAGNFTVAASVLGVGQPAVSHAVRRLEEVIGASLFDRGPGGAELTAAGRALVAEVSVGFAQVDGAVRAASRAARPDVVELAVSTSFATHWLLPRLPRFKSAHPGVDLRCSTDDTDRNVGIDGSDIWIPHGPGAWPGLDRWHLADELVYPVAAPGIADGALELGDLPDLALLHLIERYRPRMDWPRWLDEAGMTHPASDAGERFSDYSLVLHAAMAGQGVALGWHHIVGPLVEAGSLQRVGLAEVRTDESFVVLARADRPLASAAAALRDWLIAEVAAEQDSAAEPS